MFAFLAEHRASLFPDEACADLFSSIGRPSMPATRMAAVLILQALHELSDRECAEAVRCDLRWKVACGLSLRIVVRPVLAGVLAAADRPLGAAAPVIDAVGR